MASCHVLSIVIISLVFVSCSYGIGIESIRIDDKTATYISISWDIDAGSLWEQYSVDIISTSGKSLNGYPVNTTDMSHQMTGLRPEEDYDITVTPWTSEGAGNSSTTTLTTEAIPEGEILVSDVTSSSAFIQWRPVDGVFFYEIQAEPSDAIEGTGGIFEAEVGLTILIPGTVFNVTVRGGNMDLASTQIRSAPESPVNITLERIGSTEATLSWTPPTSPHDAYEFYLIINSTNERSLVETIQSEDVNGYEFTVTGLSPGALYVFEVGTVLDGSDSFSLQKSDQNDNPSVFGRTAPESPVNITLDQIGSTEATLSWTPASSPHDAYELYVIINSTNERSLCATIQTEDVNGYELTVTGLSRGALYVFEVGTVLDASDSFSLQRSDQNDNPSVFGRTAPESPVNITLERITCTESTLSWTPPTSSHDAYDFYVINNSTNERSLCATIQTEDVNGYEFTVTGLSPGAPYTFEVGTVLDASDPFSLQRSDQNDNPSVFGRTEAIDDGEILISNVTSSSAFIQWKPKEGVSSYTIVAEPSGAIEPLEDISDTEIELTIFLRGTVFNVTVRGGDPAMDLALAQIRSAPGAPLEIAVIDIKNDTVKVTLTPPTCPHDGYDLYLSNSTTNQKSLVMSVPREDEMSYERTITELSPATIYNVEVGTILNAEGVFPLQRSENNAMMTFETDDAVSHSPNDVMLLISLLAAIIMI